MNIITLAVRVFDPEIGKKRTLTLGVNGEGEGLFQIVGGGSSRQLLGTCQFHARTPREFMRKYRARFSSRYDDITMVRGSADGDWSLYLDA